MAKKIEPRNSFIIDDIFNVTKKQQKKLIEKLGQKASKEKESKNDEKSKEEKAVETTTQETEELDKIEVFIG